MTQWEGMPSWHSPCMTLLLSALVKSFLADAPTPEAKTAILRAGAPALLAARDELLTHPEHAVSWSPQETALVVSLVEDAEVLRRVRTLDRRPRVQAALGANPHTPPSDLAPPQSRIPPGSPTLEETLRWMEKNPCRTPEFCQWLVVSSPDPVAFLTAYAEGKLVSCHPEVLLTLQHHEDVMTLETFFSLVPASRHFQIFTYLQEVTGLVDAPLVEFLIRHNRAVPVRASYTPAARMLLQGSKRPEDQAVFVLSTPETEDPDPGLYQSLPVVLQTMVLMETMHTHHQQTYALLVDCDRSSISTYDPASLLDRPYLDFPARLNLMRWAHSEELIEHLRRFDYAPSQLREVTRQIFSRVPQLITLQDWATNLNEYYVVDTLTDTLVDDTLTHAPGLVSMVLSGRVAGAGPLTQALYQRTHAHCGANTALWESILTLAPQWEGTLSGLLECAGLTGTA